MDQLFEGKINALEGQIPRKLRILVAPLDWGLGHATRCIPVIRELLAQGAEVLLAGEGAQEQLLKEEFPGCPFLSLPGYRMQYAKTAIGLILKMIRQGPKMQRAIRYEQKWLQKIIDEHRLDAVISDNRYGLYSEKVPCVFITHQLNIQSPLGKWTEDIIQDQNYKYIQRFSECWIPDNVEEIRLAGKLSHPEKSPFFPFYYIGPLSRFVYKNDQPAPAKKHLLILLSGPEPQRGMLEEKIIEEVSHYNGTAVIVRGLPGNPSFIPSTGMIRIYNHLPAVELEKEIHHAEYVISRSGYSTIMDLVALQKKSILIPTPGQTEQEYLGKYLMGKKTALSYRQKEFKLQEALTAADTFPYVLPPVSSGTQLKHTVTRFLNQFRPDLG